LEFLSQEFAGQFHRLRAVIPANPPRTISRRLKRSSSGI
jgi:hypothetical protein